MPIRHNRGVKPPTTYSLMIWTCFDNNLLLWTTLSISAMHSNPLSPNVQPLPGADSWVTVWYGSQAPIKIPSIQTQEGMKFWSNKKKRKKRRNLTFPDILFEDCWGGEKKRTQTFSLNMPNTCWGGDRARGIRFLPLIGCLWWKSEM